MQYILLTYMYQDQKRDLTKVKLKDMVTIMEKRLEDPELPREIRLWHQQKIAEIARLLPSLCDDTDEVKEQDVPDSKSSHEEAEDNVEPEESQTDTLARAIKVRVTARRLP
jgi:hypothetical protein